MKLPEPSLNSQCYRTGWYHYVAIPILTIGWQYLLMFYVGRKNVIEFWRERKVSTDKIWDPAGIRTRNHRKKSGIQLGFEPGTTEKIWDPAGIRTRDLPGFESQLDPRFPGFESQLDPRFFLWTPFSLIQSGWQYCKYGYGDPGRGA